MRRAAAARRALGALALLFTAGVYGYSAWTKWLDPAGFLLALSGYGFGAGAVLGWTVPAVETALALGLLLAWIWSPRWVSPLLWVSAAGFLAFTALMGWALASGRGQAGCGCFGGAEPVGPADLARDVAFLLVAVAGALVMRKDTWRSPQIGLFDEVIWFCPSRASSGGFVRRWRNKSAFAGRASTAIVCSRRSYSKTVTTSSSS